MSGYFKKKQPEPVIYEDERRNPEVVAKELVDKRDGKYTGNELVFDPDTGQLVIKARGEPKPSSDATVLDQIAEDGFFLGIDYGIGRDTHCETTYMLIGGKWMILYYDTILIDK